MSVLDALNPVAWIGKAVDAVAAPVAEMVGGWQARKTIAAQTAGDIALAKAACEAAKWKAREERLINRAKQEGDLDLQAQEDMKATWMDEILTGCLILLVGAHFHPETQPFMEAGWKALEGAPWWLTFAVVGIFVSTFGLRGLFRTWMGLFRGKMGADPKPKSEG